MKSREVSRAHEAGDIKNTTNNNDYKACFGPREGNLLLLWASQHCYNFCAQQYPTAGLSKRHRFYQNACNIPAQRSHQDTERESDRQTETERQTETDTDRETETDRQTGRQTDRDRETELRRHESERKLERKYCPRG